MPKLSVPTLYLIGLAWTIALFVFGNPLLAFLLARNSDAVLHDVYFEVGHSPGMVAIEVIWFALACLHHWWRKLTGRTYSETSARVGWIVSFVGINLAVIPTFLLGLHGMPRRYSDHKPNFELYHGVATIGSVLLLAGLLLAAYTLVKSLFSDPGDSSGPSDRAAPLVTRRGSSSISSSAPARATAPRTIRTYRCFYCFYGDGDHPGTVDSADAVPMSEADIYSEVLPYLALEGDFVGVIDDVGGTLQVMREPGDRYHVEIPDVARRGSHVMSVSYDGLVDLFKALPDRFDTGSVPGLRFQAW